MKTIRNAKISNKWFALASDVKSKTHFTLLYLIYSLVFVPIRIVTSEPILFLPNDNI
jgi:hypothetical protein